MLNFSTEFLTQIAEDNRNYLLWIDIVFKDGTELELTNENIWANTFSINDATSSTGEFTIGASVSAQFKVTLNNIYETFNDYNFLNAIVTPYIGMDLPSGTQEKVKLGVFYCQEANFDGSVIDMVCTDYMSKFDRKYSESTLQYPATLQSIVADACNICGVVNNTKQFDNRDFVVAERPDGDNITFREIISCCSQIAGCFAKMDTDGRLTFGWYDMEFLASFDLDGGTYETDTTPYSDGDNADGGNFSDYSGGDWYSGGTFLDMQNYHIVNTFNTLTTSMDDIVVTGFKVIADGNSNDADTYEKGTDDYKITISGNCLIQDGYAEDVCMFIWNKIGGMRFRNFEATIPNNPSFESGDVGYFTDRKGYAYKCFFSNRTFKVGNAMSISCDAESPVANKQEIYTAEQKTLRKANENAQSQITAYNMAIQNLTSLMSESFGIFKTEEIQTDGSVIYTIHNKPTLALSTVCWKMTAGALVVGRRENTSQNWTYEAGIDSSGNAVVNVLSAIGINADWINVGTLNGITLSGNNIIGGTVTGTQINNGNGKFKVDANGNLYATSGTFTGDVSSARLGGGAGATVQQAIDQANEAIRLANEAISRVDSLASQSYDIANTANYASSVAQSASYTAQSVANQANSTANSCWNKITAHGDPDWCLIKNGTRNLWVLGKYQDYS